MPFLLLFIVVLTPLRAIARFVGKDMVRARAELSAGAAVLSRPDLWAAARRRTRKFSRGSASRLAPLEADAVDIRVARRERRRSEEEARRTQAAPSELEMREMAALVTRRRQVATAVAFGALTVAVVALYRFFGVSALTGGGVLPDSGALGSVWQTAFSAWIPQGSGHRGPADPILAVLALPLVFGVTLSAVLKWTLLLAVPAAAFSAWLAAGTVTRSTSLRAFAALVWAVNPLTLFAVAEGRVGALLAHTALPLAAALTARAIGLYRRDRVLSGLVGARRVHSLSEDDDDEVVLDPVPPPALPSEPRRPSLGAAAAAALAFTVVAAGSPVLLVIGTVLFLLTIAVSRHRATIWFVPLPALVLYGPWLQEVIASGTWRALLATPGVPIEATAVEPWQNLLGLPGGIELPALVDALLLAPGAALLIAALAALLRGSERARAVRVGWALAVVGLALAIVVPQVTVAHTVDGLAVNGWAGHGVTVLSAGLLLAALAGADGIRGTLKNRAFGARHVGVVVLGGAVAIVALAAPVAWVLAFDRGAAITEARVPMTPALSRQLAEGDSQARTLAMIPTAEGLRAEIWRGDGPRFSETSMIVAARAIDADADDPATESVVEAIASAAVGGQERVADELASHAIGVVLVPHEADAGLRAARDELIAALATVPGVVLVTENDSGAVFRVIEDDPASRASNVARAQLIDGESLIAPVAMSQELPERESGATLRLAERADRGWVATLEGVRLARTDDPWAQSFSVPAAGGELRIVFAPPFQSWWLWAQGFVFALTAILALPVRRRKELGQ